MNDERGYRPNDGINRACSRLMLILEAATNHVNRCASAYSAT